jgi:hypothetical protein
MKKTNKLCILVTALSFAAILCVLLGKRIISVRASPELSLHRRAVSLGGFLVRPSTIIYVWMLVGGASSRAR